jgi:small conductance mechanosensitive channel
MVFGIAYSDDIDHARRVFEDILEKHEMVLSDPVPVVRLHELGDSSVNFVVRPWVRTEDYWEAYWDIHRQVKKRLDEEGISIPFPQRDVHVHATAAETAILESHRAPAKTADE